MKVVPLKKDVVRSPVKRFHNTQDSIARLYIARPRIKDFLQSSGEGFFSRHFDPKDPVESMRRGLLFNRKLEHQSSTADEDNHRVQQKKELDEEERKILNCFLEDEEPTIETTEHAEKQSQLPRKIHRRVDPQKQQLTACSTEHSKLACYEMKLSRNKWFTDPEKFCSDDFRKLQIGLPQIKTLSSGYFKNTSAGNVDLKPELKNVLAPMKFSFKEVNKKRHAAAKGLGDSLDDRLPSFLLDKLKNQIQRQKSNSKQLSATLNSSHLWKKSKQAKSSFFHDNDSTRWSIDASHILAQSKCWSEAHSFEQ